MTDRSPTDDPFTAVPPGTALGPFRVTVSADANRRYWSAAGVEHPTLADGALYPPIAANLSILTFQQRCPHAMIQTRQHLRCHRRAQAGTPLVVTGRVARRYEKRGRDYVDVETTVAAQAAPDDPIWTSVVTFTPTASVGAAR